MCLSVSTTSIPGDLAEKLRAIAGAGFDGVELHEPDLIAFDGPPSQIRELASDHGLKICLLQPFHNLEGQTGGDREHAFERLKHKLNLMSELGTDVLLIGSAFEADAAATEDQVIADLGEAANIAQEMGLRLAYLGLPWSNLINSDEQALRIVESIDSPHLGLALNSFFSLADGSKPARLRNIPGERLFHVQLSDAPRLEMDIRRLKRHFGLLPGLGSLNLAGFVRVLARAGYNGPWSIARVNETVPQLGGRTMARDSYRALVNLLDQVSRTEPGTNFGIPDLPERVHASGFEFI
ncbi:sugar phosphate isomerase/epimerase, partial [Ruegeria sp. HKCCD8929]|uniref:sugar phosphate isomerase/epimerase family protein n=1 Tax=Ruegeria sp. HKCCD8929 TaxID=2683006 RepID=UPI0014895BA6